MRIAVVAILAILSVTIGSCTLAPAERQLTRGGMQDDLDNWDGLLWQPSRTEHYRAFPDHRWLSRQ